MEVFIDEAQAAQEFAEGACVLNLLFGVKTLPNLVVTNVVKVEI